VKGIELVIDQIVTMLQADFPAKAAALNAEYGDAYTVVAPANADYYTELINPLVPDFAYPAIVVAAQTDVTVDEDLAHAGGEWDHEVLVDVLIRAQDAHELSRRLMRTVRAVKELMMRQAPRAMAVAASARPWMDSSRHRAVFISLWRIECS